MQLNSKLNQHSFVIPSTRADKYMLHSVLRGFDLLSCFRDEKPEWGVTELSSELRITKSSAHRILVTFQENGFVKQKRNRKYVLGPRVLQLSNVYSSAVPFVQLSEPILQDLARRTNKVCHIAKLHNGEVHYLRSFSPSGKFDLRPPLRNPLHCTALGKVLLANVEPALQERLIDSIPLATYTLRTITDRKSLRDDLRQVAHRGYAVDREEFKPNLCCVAAPLFEGKSFLEAAVSLTGIFHAETEMKQHIEEVCTAAEQISSDMESQKFCTPGLEG